MTRKEWAQCKLMQRLFDTYEAYRRSLPRREWVQLPSGGWVTRPWPWDVD